MQPQNENPWLSTYLLQMSSRSSYMIPTAFFFSFFFLPNKLDTEPSTVHRIGNHSMSDRYIPSKFPPYFYVSVYLPIYLPLYPPLCLSLSLIFFSFLHAYDDFILSFTHCFPLSFFPSPAEIFPLFHESPPLKRF